MSTQLKLRRGTTVEHSTFTGAEGEVTVDTTKDTLVVHDAVTVGGHVLAKEVNTAAKDPTTGAVYLGAGTTLQRPVLSSEARAMWYNTDLSKFEGWDGAAWVELLSSANVVTLDTAQSVTGDKTFTTKINLQATHTTANDSVIQLKNEGTTAGTTVVTVPNRTMTLAGEDQLSPKPNYIINGGFNYWDYATSQTTSGYGSDNRWINGNTGSTKTHSQVLSGDTERVLFNSSKFSRTVVTSVAGAGNYVSKVQKIENVTKLADKTITISFWAKADTNKNIAVSFTQDFGTGGTPSTGVSGISPTIVPLTTTMSKKTVTVTLPSIVGKTLGTDGVHTSSTHLTFWFDAGSNYATESANLGQQSGTFDIAEVKLEEGSVATPWTPYEGEFGGEIQACQRYYRSYTRFIPATGIVSFDGNFRTTPTLSGTGAATTISNDKSGFVLQESSAQTRTVTASAEL